MGRKSRGEVRKLWQRKLTQLVKRNLCRCGRKRKQAIDAEAKATAKLTRERKHRTTKVVCAAGLNDSVDSEC